MEIKRRIVFHAGHMLKDDQSKCYNPHGHEYVFECTVEGEVQKEQTGREVGMVMNFGRVKEIMMLGVHDVFDHKFLVQQSDPRQLAFIQAMDYKGVEIVPWAPTAENLAEYCYNVVQNHMPKGVRVARVRIQETLNCWAEYYGENYES